MDNKLISTGKFFPSFYLTSIVYYRFFPMLLMRDWMTSKLLNGSSIKPNKYLFANSIELFMSKDTFYSFYWFVYWLNIKIISF